MGRPALGTVTPRELRLSPLREPPQKSKIKQALKNLRVGAPGKPLLRVSVAWDLVCELAPRVCDIVRVLVMVSVLSVILSCPSYSQKSGLSDGTTPLGSKLLVRLLFGIALWGRFPWWGDLWPLGTKVPHNDSPEGRGGPWAPPPRIFFSKLCCFFWGFLSASANGCSLKGMLLWEFL